MSKCIKMYQNKGKTGFEVDNQIIPNLKNKSKVTLRAYII